MNYLGCDGYRLQAELGADGFFMFGLQVAELSSPSSRETRTLTFLPSADLPDVLVTDTPGFGSVVEALPSLVEVLQHRDFSSP